MGYRGEGGGVGGASSTDHHTPTLDNNISE